MNASSNSSDSKSRSPRRGPWIYSLTTVCFLFGGLMAAQLRAVEQVRINKKNEAVTDEITTKQALNAKRKYEDEKARSSKLKSQLSVYQSDLKRGRQLSQQQIATLTARINELQAASGLTELTGPGIVLTLDDSPTAAANADPSDPFLPGIVHDFDLLQVVNELRANKAEGISVNGARITAYTPIRCVGPSIQINWNPVTPPFRIEAVGRDADVLEKGLNLPGGILDNLRRQTLVVRLSKKSSLTLPAAEGVPSLKTAPTRVARRD